MNENKFNSKVKIYPDGNFKATYCNMSIFSNQHKKVEIPKTEPMQDWEKILRNIEGQHRFKSISAKELEAHGVTNFNEFIEYTSNKEKWDKKRKRNQEKNNKKIDIHNIERSLKRAKDKIFDIAYINNFKYFVTFTFDTKLVDSKNAKEVMKKLRVWLSNQKQRFGMEYILVPEYHEKGEGGIHCHLLISDYPMNLLEHAPMHKKGGEVVHNKDGSVRLMYTSKGKPIYNMLGWKYGFSTCIPIYKEVNHSNIKLAHYITKYITKGVYKIFGKFYWSSKGLDREVNTQFFNSDYFTLPLKEYKVPNTHICLKYESQFEYVIGGNSNDGQRKIVT